MSLSGDNNINLKVISLILRSEIVYLKPGGTHWNSTQSPLLKINRVALAPYTLATKLNVSTTKTTVKSRRIQVFADLLPKSATKLTVSATTSIVSATKSTLSATTSTVSATKSTISATVDFVADLLQVSATVDFQQSRPCWIQLCRQCVLCVPGLTHWNSAMYYGAHLQTDACSRSVQHRKFTAPRRT